MCGVEDSRLSRLDERRVWEGGGGGGNREC